MRNAAVIRPSASCHGGAARPTAAAAPAFASSRSLCSSMVRTIELLQPSTKDSASSEHERPAALSGQAHRAHDTRIEAEERGGRRRRENALTMTRGVKKRPARFRPEHTMTMKKNAPPTVRTCRKNRPNKPGWAGHREKPQFKSNFYEC